MNTAIQSLNEKICEDYTVSIICDRSRILDLYEEGELEEVFFTEGFYHRSFDTNPHNLSSYLKAAVEHFLIHYTQYRNFEECIDKNFDYSDGEFIIYRHVNSQNNDPSEEDIELWKKGEINLYAQYTRIKVKVNDRLIDFELIKDLIETEVR